jgi:hypothetical protein
LRPRRGPRRCDGNLSSSNNGRHCLIHTCWKRTDITTVQDLLAHRHVSTTMVATQIAPGPSESALRSLVGASVQSGARYAENSASAQLMAGSGRKQLSRTAVRRTDLSA